MSYDRSPFSLTPWVRRLLVVTGIVFLLQRTVFYGGGLDELFLFTPADILHRPWSALTYALLHEGPLHFFLNMLVLFMFGPPVENRLGSSSFIRLYILSAIGGALLSVMMLPLTGNTQIIGASAAVYGVMMGFVLEWPDAPVLIFPLPVPVKAKWLVIFVAAFSLVSGLLQVGDHVAHFAHLGGFGAAFLYLRGGQLLSRPRAMRPTERSPAVLGASRPGASDGIHQADYASPIPPRPTPDATVKAEVDRVLDKISQRGMHSLTPEERRFLDEMSKRFRQDR
ncbi:MAG TPA: rhomboid family intramembrane serine protease [Gemmatimonadales bacterium]|jgi:membrane associated rhomboid family serine protease